MPSSHEFHSNRAEIWQVAADNQVQKYVISAFAAIAWYSSIELIVLCFTTFNKYRCCYFWSLLIASSSLIPHCLGYILFIFPVGVTPYVSVTLIIVSWCAMVTGHSLVLWSRLNLVLQAPKILRFILAMIITDAIIFHVPTIVLLYGSLSIQVFSTGYNVMERVQLIGFCVQECIISGIYVWETSKMLRLRPDTHNYNILAQLLLTNIVILILDIAVVGIEYAGYYALQVMFKPVAYSIKFKLEYAILGRLVQIAKGSCSNEDSLSYAGGSVDRSNSASNPHEHAYSYSFSQSQSQSHSQPRSRRDGRVWGDEESIEQDLRTYSSPMREVGDERRDSGVC